MKKKLRFKAYSAKHLDADEVLLFKRERGSSVNDPILVFGRSIVEAEQQLKAIKHEIEKLGIDIQLNKRGSFAIEVSETIAAIIIQKYGHENV